MRQWVLSLPYRLRYLLAWDHRLCRAVLSVFVRALLDFYRRQARQHGVPDGRTGTLTVIQRFGGGLNLNVHFHTLVLDGVISDLPAGSAPFHPASPPSDEDFARLAVANTLIARIDEEIARRTTIAGERTVVTPPAAGPGWWWSRSRC